MPLLDLKDSPHTSPGEAPDIVTRSTQSKIHSQRPPMPRSSLALAAFDLHIGPALSPRFPRNRSPTHGVANLAMKRPNPASGSSPRL
jgi:hypothetical protein